METGNQDRQTEAARQRREVVMKSAARAGTSWRVRLDRVRLEAADYTKDKEALRMGRASSRQVSSMERVAKPKSTGAARSVHSVGVRNTTFSTTTQEHRQGVPSMVTQWTSASNGITIHLPGSEQSVSYTYCGAPHRKDTDSQVGIRPVHRGPAALTCECKAMTCGGGP